MKDYSEQVQTLSVPGKNAIQTSVKVSGCQAENKILHCWNLETIILFPTQESIYYDFKEITVNDVQIYNSCYYLK